MKLAPTLQKLSLNEWNFYGVAGDGLIGGEYRKAEDAAWKAADAELRALLAVAKAASRNGMHCRENKWTRVCDTCRALARLECVSRKP